MQLRRRLGLVMIFTCMPAMAPLWAMLADIALGTMIRVLTPIFVLGLLLTFAGADDTAEEEEFARRIQETFGRACGFL
ncbi:MAG TPA: hypothetical protein EYQ80_00505 [Candidatus Poseidoniales archaeon]|nr:hypothetical protein [Candidatus Poseidoniales archaeon]